MNKRTSVILETDLLKEAERILGTRGPTATVRAALEETVRREHLENLSRWELPEDFPAQLEGLRASESARA